MMALVSISAPPKSPSAFCHITFATAFPRHSGFLLSVIPASSSPSFRRKPESSRGCSPLR